MRDLYPETEEEYRKLNTWLQDAFLAASNARTPFEERWDRYDKLYEAYIRREKGDWRSKVFMPEIFQQIETIKPRLISQLPKFRVLPVGAEDVEVSRTMETLIEWAAHSSKLHLELFKTFHPTLLYGTGILKTFPDTQYAWGSEMVPIFETEEVLNREPLIDPETQRQMTDLDGNLMWDEKTEEVQVPVGMEPKRKRYVAYDGPAAKAVNIRNFWVAPEAEDVQSARYAFHRTFKDFRDVERLVAKGVYRWPEGMDDPGRQIFQGSEHNDPRLLDLDKLDMGAGSDATRKQVELLEVWIKDGPDQPGRVVTWANRSHILRVHENPFWHGQKPFIRFVDYLMPHRFWGIGEVQHMEGIQDAINAITNQRIDAGRLTIDPMYGADTQAIDPNLLKTRPGGVVPIKADGLPLNTKFARMEMGEVSQYAFQEVSALQQMGERTTAVSSYQQGVDMPSQLDTATGAAIMNEAGSSRFALKSTLHEIGPLAEIGMQFGSMLQQFTTDERKVRLVGQDGAATFVSLDPSALQGNLDYTVESSSAQQSETIKRQQAIEVFNQVIQASAAGLVPPHVTQVAFKELLETMGAKSIIRAMEEAPPQPMLPEQPLEQPMPQ